MVEPITLLEVTVNTTTELGDRFAKIRHPHTARV